FSPTKVGNRCLAITGGEWRGAGERGAVSASRQEAAAFVRVAVSGEIVNLFTKFQVAPAPAPVYIVR
ncbi:MAG: hypothetical protein WAV18_10780, partial [Roseiarcus sp.]